MKILSCGAGQQSTALALMSCENALSNKTKYPLVPIYDAVLFCDLGGEREWVYKLARMDQTTTSSSHRRGNDSTKG